MIFEGEIQTVTPFYQTTPSGPKNKTNTMVVFHENGIADVPIISPNTIRAMLRYGISMDILNKIGDRKLDYLTLGFLVVGGTLDPKRDGNSDTNIRAVVDAIKQIKERNIVARLFGGGCGSFMIEGKTVVSPAVLICEETVGITGIDSEFPAEKFMAVGFSSIRRDPMLSDINVFTKLSEEGVEELESRFMQHKQVSNLKRGEKRKKKQKSTEKTDVIVMDDVDIESEEERDSVRSADRTLRNIMDSITYVVPGARFYSRIEIPGVDDVEIGAIYSALMAFSAYPRLGSMKSKMGEVKVKYRVLDSSGEEVDRVRIDGSDPTKRFTFGNSRFLEAYNNYLDKLTIEDILIPRIGAKGGR